MGLLEDVSFHGFRDIRVVEVNWYVSTGADSKADRFDEKGSIYWETSIKVRSVSLGQVLSWVEGLRRRSYTESTMEVGKCDIGAQKKKSYSD